MAQCTPKSFDLTGKVALITGASYGIGMAIAKAMAANGATIVFNDIKQELVDKGLAAYEEAGIKAHGYVCDVTDEDAVNAMVAKITEEVGHINILVNNAGVFFFDDLTETDSRRIERMIGLHVQTVTMLCRYFGAAMKARGKGYILNMSSMSAGMPFPGISVYAATKSYLKQFSKAIHNELYDYGVRVTAVCPGAVATDLYNLSGHYQRLGLRLGILMRPERLARKGLRALFAGRRCVTPGAVNHLFMPLAALVPSRLIRLIKRRAKFYRYGR